jgi:opacity protein-like surface antigen
MTKILTTALVASTIAMAGGDIAQIEETPTPTPVTDAGFYVGAGYAYIDAEATDGYDTANNALDLRVGYNFNKFVAVEGRYAFGAEDDVDFNGYTTPYQAEIDTWGIFVKPQYPVGDATVYALLGYGNVDGTFDGENELDENGFQWGLGAKYAVTQNVEVFADYINAYNDTVIIEDETLGLDVYTVTIGVNYKF